MPRPGSAAEWVAMHQRPGGKHDYSARFKLLYSPTGIYVLFDGTDQTLTATMTEDFLDLWNEDVYECFFWTDQRYPVYFEYEISPLGYELPILIPNFEGQFLGWRPWHYEGDRRTRKKVTVSGGPQVSQATVSGWRAEVFIPYDLLKPLQNVPPQPGSRCAPISTAWTTTEATRPAGTGRASGPVFTSSASSEHSSSINRGRTAATMSASWRLGQRQALDGSPRRRDAVPSEAGHTLPATHSERAQERGILGVETSSRRHNTSGSPTPKPSQIRGLRTIQRLHLQKRTADRNASCMRSRRQRSP